MVTQTPNLPDEKGTPVGADAAARPPDAAAPAPAECTGPRRVCWSDLSEAVRDEFAGRVLAGQPLGAIRAGMGAALAGFSERTLHHYKYRIRREWGAAVRRLPSPSRAARAAALADLLAPVLIWWFGRLGAADLVREVAARLAAGRACAPVDSALGGKGGAE